LWSGLASLPAPLAEIGALFLVLFLAGMLATYLEGQATGRSEVWLALGLLAAALLSVALLVATRDLGMAGLVLGLILLMVYVATGASLPVLATLALFAALVALAAEEAAAPSAPAAAMLWQPVQAWVDPWADPFKGGWQVLQGLICLAHGALTGAGPGLGLLEALPKGEGSMIYAVAGEELGYAGCAALLLCYGLIGWRGFQLAMACQEPFLRLLAAGLSSLLCLQVVAAVGGVLRVLPVSRLGLPFLSYGGASLVSAFVVVGLLLCVSRDGEALLGAEEDR
jgi:cell division protein FtsW (lipid II flippase)